MRVLLLKPHQGESSAVPDGVQLVKFVVSRRHCVYTRVDSERERINCRRADGEINTNIHTHPFY